MMRRLLAVVLVLCAAGAHAQSFPSRPVRIVIGFPPGGGIDTVARIMGPKMSEGFKQPVIVENRPGANGVPAMELVAKSPPDGHTVFMGTSGNLAMNPVFYANLPYSMERDFLPVSLTASLPFLIVANPALPAGSVAELIAYAKANPGKVNYSSSGNGSTPHLAGELFNTMAGIRTVHVPYKGSAPSIADLLAGQVQYTFDAVSITLPHVKSGKLKVLGHTGPQRLSYLPDVPPAAESLPGYEVVNWYGVVVPSGTPQETVARLNAEIAAALADAEVRQKIVAIGIDPASSTPEALGAFMKAETVKWARVVKDANIVLQ
jgi:tripartite-type tricarboxylate transporter receptor subunit TctC